MTGDDWWEKASTVLGHRTLAERDQGRLKLLLSFHDKSDGDPARDWLAVITEYSNSSTTAEEITRQDFNQVTQEQLDWLSEWMERRKGVLLRIAAFERKLGIDRETYNIDGSRR